MATKSNILKNALIEAMEQSLGVVTQACKKVDCNRSTFYKYYNRDKRFRLAIDDIQEVALDFAESQLHKQINDGNTSATIFYLKTKGKKRGYVERLETVDKSKFEDQFDELSDEELEELAIRTAKRIGNG